MKISFTSHKIQAFSPLYFILLALILASCKPDRAKMDLSSANYPDNSTIVFKEESQQVLTVKNLNAKEQFSLSAAEPRFISLQYENKFGPRHYWLYLEGADYDIVLDYNSKDYPLRKTNSKVQLEIMEYEQLRQARKRRIDDSLSLALARFDKSTAYHSDSTKTGTYLNERVKDWEDSLAVLEFKILSEFTRSHPSSPSIPFLLSKLNGFMSNPKLAMNILDQADASVQRSKLANQLREDASKLISTMPGAVIPSIAGADKNGQPFSDKVLKRVNLIICYASYSNLTRAEHPALKLIYQRFKTRDVEFIGVAFDKNEKFMRSVEKMDGLTWPQYSDFLAAKSPNFVLNNGEIPYIFVIDKNHKILSSGISLNAKSIADELDEWVSKTK